MLTLALVIGGWISSGKTPSTFLTADLAVQLQQMMNAPITLRYAEDADPNIRMQQLLNQSEHSGPIEWHRHQRPDQPSHLTPQRVNGLISP